MLGISRSLCVNVVLFTAAVFQCSFLATAQSGCSTSWVQQNNTHAFGLKLVGQAGQYTVDQCLRVCEQDATCRTVDYNRRDKTCYIGSQSNPPTRPLTDIDHYDLRLSCDIVQSTTTYTSQTGETSANEECKNSFVLYDDRVSQNGVRITAISSALKCINACTNTATCAGLEMKTLTDNSVECWLHFNSADFSTFTYQMNTTQLVLKKCPEGDLYLCMAAFTETQMNQFSAGGQAVPYANTLEKCQQTCQSSVPPCRGIDFYTTTNSCYMHNISTLGQNLQSQAGANQYRMDDICSTTCNPKWNRYDNSKGSGGLPITLNSSGNNVTACLEFCLRNSSCIGITYTTVPGSAPECIYYTAAQSSSMEQRQTVAWAVQYELEDRCFESCQTEFIKLNDTRIYMYDPKQVSATTPEECRLRCSWDSSCTAYQYTKSGTFVCTICFSWVYGSATADSTYDSAYWNTYGCTSSELQTTTNECELSYTQYKNRVSLNGVRIAAISTPLNCMDACTATEDCEGLDMKVLADNSIECWLHFNSKDFDTKYTAANSTQIVYKRCPEEGVYLCNATFTETQVGQFSTGGQAKTDANTLDKCQKSCQDAGPACRGVDFYSDTNTCYLHSVSTLGQNLQARASANQYRMDDVCSSGCIPKWTRYDNSKGSGGLPAVLSGSGNNVTACLEYCLRNPACIGISYTTVPGSVAECVYYTSAQSSSMAQREAVAWAVQYELTDRCYVACQTRFQWLNNTRSYLLNPVQVSATNPQECETMCNVDALCSAFQYTKSGTFVCTVAKNFIQGSETADSNYDTAYFEIYDCTNQPQDPPPTPASP